MTLPVEQAFGQVIREYRTQRGWSQEYLSEQSHLDRTFISHVERGTKIPSLLTIVQLAHSFNVSAADLMQAMEDKITQ